jgi:tetratricopeptide (TPR) repeat protein
MSGAALFVDDYLIGVVSGDPVQWGHARIEAIPISSLVEDPTFTRVVRQVTGVQPGLLEITRPVQQAGYGVLNSIEPVWQNVADVEPVGFGAHRVPEVPGHPQVVGYVPREVDSQLNEHIELVAEEGGMILLTGDSAAGKSRALFEAMRRNLGNWLVCKPDPDAELPSLLSFRGEERRVVWLDDLHEYMHSNGLSISLLDALVNRRVVVLATLRADFYDHYSEEQDSPFASAGSGPRLPSSPGRIIRRAHHITLERRWTDSERQSASLNEDPRISAALKSDRAYGLAEYLAAGPQVLKLWRSAFRVKGNPRGAALVSAAIDLARTGVDSSLPPEAVERLHEYYLNQAGGPALRPEDINEAWEWASRVVLGVTSPLLPAQAGTWKPFDYLVSDVARQSHPRDLPDQVWKEALRIVDDSRRALVATVARVAGRVDVAKEILHPLADVDDPDGLINLGALLASENDYEVAGRYFRRASELGDSTGTHNMGSVCFATGDLEGALGWYTLAVERGELQSIGALGLVTEKMGNQDQAVEIWKRGTAAGDPGSALHYSDWLASKWQSDEAAEAMRVAADGALPIAALSYAGILLRKKDHDAANSYVSKAYDSAIHQGHVGDPLGYLMAGVTAYSFGNVEMGREWWNRARDNGAQIDWFVLEAAQDFPGLRHLAVSQKMLERLGEEGTRLLMQVLWAGDCLDCGYPLKEGVPALYVDDRYTKADARLFHFGMCRFPRWNDSALTTFSKAAGISWNAFTAGVPAGDEVIPALIVNPALEMAQLVLDDQGWTATSMYGPRSVMGSGLNLRPLWAGLPPKRNDSFARAIIGDGEVAVAAVSEIWSAPAQDQAIELVKQYGGLLLILTSAFGPNTPANIDALMSVLESWDSMTCWVPLGP